MFKSVSGALQLLPELVQFYLQHFPPLPLVCQLGLQNGQLPGEWTDKFNVETDRFEAEYCVHGNDDEASCMSMVEIISNNL